MRVYIFISLEIIKCLVLNQRYRYVETVFCLITQWGAFSPIKRGVI